MSTDTAGISINATVLSFHSVRADAVEVEFRVLAAVYTLDKNNAHFEETMRLLAWSWKEQKPVSIRVVGSTIMSAKKAE